MMSPQPRLDSLQVGRAFAALAVLASHAVQYAQLLDPAMSSVVGRLLAHGYLGVDFFFVLSGFIIHYTMAGRTGVPGWARDYAFRRTTRLYLPYLPIGLAVGLLYASVPGFADPSHRWNWVSTLTLLPVGSWPALDQAWTLEHEVLFYAFYGLTVLTLGERRLSRACLGWGGAILVTAALSHLRVPGAATAIRWVALSPINLEFLFGIAAAQWVLKAPIRRGWVAAGLGVALIAVFLVVDRRPWSPFFGAGLALMLVPLIRGDMAGRIASPQWLVRLGDASYAIYLVHLPLMAIVIWFGALAGLPWWLVLSVLAAASIAAGLLYHFGFERPVLRAVRGRAGQPWAEPATSSD